MSVEPLDSILFISHRACDVALVATLVDFLEEAIPELEGAILCSSLPGYTAQGGNTRRHAALVAVYTGETESALVADVMRALERQTPALVLRLRPDDALTGALARAAVLEFDRAGLSTLMEDVAFAFDVLPRLSDAGRAQLTELLLAVHELRDVGKAADEGTGLRTVEAAVAPRGIDAASHPTPQITTASARASGAVPQPPRAGALRCAEAGVLLSECLYHDLTFEHVDDTDRAQLQGLYIALGGGKLDAVATVDPEAYQRGIDEVLSALPIERHYLAHWFEAGFQLALACNLGLCAGDGIIPAELAAARSEAWTAFAVAASELRIGPGPVSAIAAELAQLLEVPTRYAMHREHALQQLLGLAREHDEARLRARRQRQQAYA